MSNAPVILTLDTDMYSNDPQTPLRVLCYLLDPAMDPKLGYIQFPQIFHGINENDIYGGQLKLEFQIEASGMDGLVGSTYTGTGCFFRRGVFFGGPLETPELNQDHLVNKSINSKEVLAMAHHVADCNFEKQTKWGTEVSMLVTLLLDNIDKKGRALLDYLLCGSVEFTFHKRSHFLLCVRSFFENSFEI